MFFGESTRLLHFVFDQYEPLKVIPTEINRYQRTMSITVDLGFSFIPPAPSPFLPPLSLILYFHSPSDGILDFGRWFSFDGVLGFPPPSFGVGFQLTLASAMSLFPSFLINVICK